MAEKSDVIDNNFGVVIAFWLPGFLLLWGLAYSFPQVSALIPKPTEGDAPTVGGFLYVALASLAVGLIVSAIRWMIVDTLMHATGVRQPRTIEYKQLKNQDVLNAFQAVVENHYRYYQYYFEHASQRFGGVYRLPGYQGSWSTSLANLGGTGACMRRTFLWFA
jgi:hypothetical protein